MDMNIKVCDVQPVIGEATRHYKLAVEGGREVELDLCVTHAQPLEELLGVKVAPRPARKVAATKKATTRRRGRPRVVTLAEIEERKSAG